MEATREEYRVKRLLVYHNPGCSKSRGALEILRERGVEHDVVAYLEAPLSRADLSRLLELLPDPPGELVRKDKNFAALGLDAERYTESEAVIDLLLEHPKLMQRPIAVLGDHAVIGRPSEKVLELVEGS
jgi:arsenate reductase